MVGVFEAASRGARTVSIELTEVEMASKRSSKLMRAWSILVVEFSVGLLEPCPSVEADPAVVAPDADCWASVLCRNS